MPQVAFETLPDDARVWVFGTTDPVSNDDAASLLRAVDASLAHWEAHGHPLRSAREWRDGRFLAVGVDQSTAAASGCSIDALFGLLQGMEKTLGTALVTGGRVFYRDANQQVQCVDRATYTARARTGAVDGDTRVFDTTLTSARAYREGFERAAATSWHAKLA